ncbi:hypothetical protein GpartN1_g3217.t1 [Galdieria partita]|uniref:Uncharacterized protein n=1 Tax=Galdieria partita TaxID=83374 RepID=A0A9C7UQ97_9RHOD|nr:hypothetical protein GpartN1_g3217.t1 [Galdieria partita]
MMKFAVFLLLFIPVAFSCSLHGPDEGSIKNLINTITHDVTTLQNYMQQRQAVYRCIFETCPVCEAVHEIPSFIPSPTSSSEELSAEQRIIVELQLIDSQRRAVDDAIFNVQLKPECELCLQCALDQSAFQCQAVTFSASATSSSFQSQQTQKQIPVFSSTVIPRPTRERNQTRFLVV